MMGESQPVPPVLANANQQLSLRFRARGFLPWLILRFFPPDTQSALGPVRAILSKWNEPQELKTENGLCYSTWQIKKKKKKKKRPHKHPGWFQALTTSILMIQENNSTLFSMTLFTQKHTISCLVFINVDNIQRMSWLSTYETTKLGGYLQHYFFLCFYFVLLSAQLFFLVKCYLCVTKRRPTFVLYHIESCPTNGMERKVAKKHHMHSVTVHWPAEMQRLPLLFCLTITLFQLLAHYF